MSNGLASLKRPQPPILVFDIETVPDIPLLYHRYGHMLEQQVEKPDSIWNDVDFLEKFKAETKVDFPQTLFHAVVSICAVFVDPISYTILDGIKLTVPTTENYENFKSAEKKILESFWQFCLKHENFHKTWYDANLSDMKYGSDYYKNKLKKLPLTFCGYNISSFDLMVLEQRSLINFITCPISDYAKNLGVDSYRYKYASDKVFDLINFVSNYDNRNSKVGLDILATALGLGGKMTGMDGSQIAKQYFQEKNIQVIEEYCAIDVLITYGVLLAVQKFRGILNEIQFKECLQWFEQWLLKESKPESYHNLAQTSQKFFRGAKHD